MFRLAILIGVLTSTITAHATPPRVPSRHGRVHAVDPYNQQLMNSYGSVTPDLFVGGWAVAHDPSKMRRLAITHIVNAVEHRRPNAKLQKINYLNFALEDDRRQLIIPAVEQASDFIERAIADGGRVYVHCDLGVSRSVGLVTGHLMRTGKTAFSSAFRRVKDARPEADDWTFGPQLSKWSPGRSVVIPDPIDLGQ